MRVRFFKLRFTLSNKKSSEGTGKLNSDGPPPYHDLVAHQKYFFDSGNCMIQVERTLFKVWDHTIRLYSPTFFARHYAQYAIPDVGGYGGAAVFVSLPGVKTEDFEVLMSVLYPAEIGKYSTTSVDDWISALELSTYLYFPSVRALAIMHLSSFKLDSIRKIQLQRQYDIECQWAYEAYIDLCSRMEPLTAIEASILGPEVTSRVSRVREKLSNAWWGKSRQKLVKKLVCDEFILERRP